MGLGFVLGLWIDVVVLELKGMNREGSNVGVLWGMITLDQKSYFTRKPLTHIIMKQTLSFGNPIPSRGHRNVVMTSKILKQLRTVEDSLKEDCPKYLINPNLVVVQELPLSTQYKIRSFVRYSNRLTNLFGLEKYCYSPS